MIIPFNNTKGQCSSSIVTYSTCSTAYTLASPLNANCDYWWYECDAYGSNTNVLNGGASTPGINVSPPSSTGNQTTYYIYYEVNNSTLATCSSAVITIQWDYDLEIATNGSTPPTYSLQTFTTLPSYSNFQWKLNGSAIASATNNYISPTTSGIYTLDASSSCGPRTSSNSFTYIAPNNQCSTNPTGYLTCGSTYTLSHTPAAGYNVTWYQCDAYGANGTALNGGSPSNSVTVSPTSNTTQAFYYYYVCTDVFSSSTCTSAVITVVFETDLPIVSNTMSVLPATLSAQPFSSGNPVYSSYQWYRNYNIIPGANSDTYYATLPGDYFLTCTSICGTSSSNTLSFACQSVSSTNFTNFTFTTASSPYTFTSDEIYISGTLTIPADVTVTFDDCKIYMDACAKIVVDKGNTNGGNLSILNSTIASCDTWQGIEVVGDNVGWVTTVHQATSASLIMYNTDLHDAMTGIYVHDYGYIYIDRCLFENNMKHVKMVSCWEMDGYVNNSKFSYLSFGQALCGAYAPAPIAQADCQYVSMVSFENDSFECYYSLNGSHTEYGLFADPIHFNPYVAAHEGLVIRDCKFLGDYDHCVHIETPNYLHIDGTGLSEFVGNFNQAIYLIYGNATNQYIQKQYIHNTSTNNTGGGIFVKQGVKTNIEDCSISNVVSGIEFYNNASIGAGNMSHIVNNDIDDCTYGISVASDLAEWTPSPCPACTTNTMTNRIQLDMYCNRITNCDYGIIGMGPIVDQGTTAGGGGGALQDWSNRFCTNFSSHTCNAGSSNNYADVAWYNGGTHSNTNIYGDISGGNRALKTMVGTIYIHNTAITSGSWEYDEHYPGIGQSIDYYCNGNTYNINKEETSIQNTTANNNDYIRIYPNPASENLIIEQIGEFNNNYLQVQIVDQTGRLVFKSASQSVQTTINITNLAEGIYTLRIIDLKAGGQFSNKISIMH